MFERRGGERVGDERDRFRDGRGIGSGEAGRGFERVKGRELFCSSGGTEGL